VPLLTKVVSSPLPDGSGQLEQGGTAFFKDGSSKHVDAIMLCTGYIHHFPFLSGDLLLNPHSEEAKQAGQPKNKIWLKGLYRGIFWMKNPKLIHVGPHTGFFTMNLFDAQVHACRGCHPCDCTLGLGGVAGQGRHHGEVHGAAPGADGGA
jgi:trimethylamine monooxygenase